MREPDPVLERARIVVVEDAELVLDRIHDGDVVVGRRRRGGSPDNEGQHAADAHDGLTRTSLSRDPHELGMLARERHLLSLFFACASVPALLVGLPTHLTSPGEPCMRPGNPAALEQPYDPIRVESHWTPLGRARVFRPSSESARSEPFTMRFRRQRDRVPDAWGTCWGVDPRVILRWQRMEGREVLYIPAWPTPHRHPERGRGEAAREAGRATTLGAKRSCARVWAWKEQYGGLILKQLRRVGTLAGVVPRAIHARSGLFARVMLCFRALRERAHLPRPVHRQLVPACMTALSDEEVDHVETEGKLCRALPDQGHRSS